MVKSYKQILIICGLLITIVIGIVVYFYQNNIEDYSYLEISNEIDDNKNIIEEEVKQIVVHITGEVVNQGIIKLPKGSRIIDAVEAAGGVTQKADLSKINLAYVIEDGVKIYKANIEELQNLPGIGESIANRIVSHRNENGEFKTIEDLKNVSGIGDAKFNNIKNYICVK